MPLPLNLSRIGDINNAGGAIIRGAFTVFCNGIPVGLHVSPITPHLPFTKRHKLAITTTACFIVIAEGSPVLRLFSGNSCGHFIIEGSPDTFVPP